MAAKNEYNFDHPDAFDFELLKTTLQRLKEGRKVEVPIYNFVTHSRENRTVSFKFLLVIKKSYLKNHVYLFSFEENDVRCQRYYI